MKMVDTLMKPFLGMALTILLIGALTLVPAVPTLAFDIDTLRKQQAGEFDALLDDFSNRAKKPGANQADLTRQYREQRRQIIEKYRKIDGQRHAMIEKTLSKYGRDHIKNTGTLPPKTIGADADYVAKTKHAYNRLREDWDARGDKVIDMKYGLRNKTTDEVVWKPDRELTPAQRRAKLAEQDAYITQGGLKSTGVRGRRIKSSDAGAGLDPARKLVFGLARNDIKDVGKSLVKITAQAEGRNIAVRDEDGVLTFQKSLDSSAINRNERLRQANELKNYHDPVEAGIFNLADSPSTREKKMAAFKKDCVDLAIEKQAALDVSDLRKQRYSKALIESLPPGSTVRGRVEKRLDQASQSNIEARKQVNDTLKALGMSRQLVPEAEIRQREQAQFEQRQATLDREREQLLEAARQRKADNRPGLPQKVKTALKTKIKQMKTPAGAGSFLVSAYQMNQAAETIKQEGGNDFISINQDDSQLMKNAKAYLGAGIDASAFGGGWSGGKRAVLEEQERIKEAIAKGKTTNALISFTRSAFWGLAYTVKDTVTGSIDFIKQQAIAVDEEIKAQIKDSVQRKYAAKTREESNSLVQEKREPGLTSSKRRWKNRCRITKIFFQNGNNP